MIAGARVIGIVRTVDKAQVLADVGVDVVLNSREEDVAARIMDITGGESVAAVFDGVAKDTFDLGLKVLARDGTRVSYGNASGNVIGFDVDRLRETNLCLMRPSMSGYVRTRVEFVGFVEKLFDFIAGLDKMGLKGSMYSLAQVQDAYRDLEGRKTQGKLLLKL